MSRGRIAGMVRKEFRQAFRDPRLRVLMIVPPIVQFLVFGFVVNLDIEQSRMAWVDGDRTPASRELRAAFEASGRFTVTAAPESLEAAQRLMDRDEVHSVVAVLPGFAADLARGRQARIQVLIDGSNSNTASILSGYAAEIVRGYSGSRFEAVLNQKKMARGGALVELRSPGIGLEQRVWFNPELRSRNYFIPGVLVNILAIVTLMLTSMAIVREKEIGTMEQLMVTPIRPVELMIGKTLPFALVSMLDLVLIVVLARLVFRVPFVGDAWVLGAGAVLFLLSTLGLGLFISTVSATQQQAIMATFFFFFPMSMLSGFAFPVRSMPEVVQYFTLLNPLRYFLEICRGVMIKGSGVETLWPQLAALAVFGVSILWFSARRFRKRLD